MADENLVLARHAFADERVGGGLAAGADMIVESVATLDRGTPKERSSPLKTAFRRHDVRLLMRRRS
jgi:hypothetical protein